MNAGEGLPCLAPAPGPPRRAQGKPEAAAGRGGVEWRLVPRFRTMRCRYGYWALLLGDLDGFQQSNFGFLGSQKDCLFPERGGVGLGAGEWPPSTEGLGGTRPASPGPNSLPLRSQLVWRSGTLRGGSERKHEVERGVYRAPGC